MGEFVLIAFLIKYNTYLDLHDLEFKYIFFNPIEMYVICNICLFQNIYLYIFFVDVSKLQNTTQ